MVQTLWYSKSKFWRSAFHHWNVGRTKGSSNLCFRFPLVPGALHGVYSILVCLYMSWLNFNPLAWRFNKPFTLSACLYYRCTVVSRRLTVMLEERQFLNIYLGLKCYNDLTFFRVTDVIFQEDMMTITSEWTLLCLADLQKILFNNNICYR